VLVTRHVTPSLEIDSEGCSLKHPSAPETMQEIDSKDVVPQLQIILNCSIGSGSLGGFTP